MWCQLWSLINTISYIFILFPRCHGTPKQRFTTAFQLMEKKIYSTGYSSKSRKRWQLIYVSASPGFGAGEISPRYFQLQPKLLVTAFPAQKLQDSPQLDFLIQKYLSQKSSGRNSSLNSMCVKFFQLPVFRGVLSGTHISLLFSSSLLVSAMIEWWHQRP